MDMAAGAFYEKIFERRRGRKIPHIGNYMFV